MEYDRLEASQATSIQVWSVNTHDDRTLTLRHSQDQRRPLNQNAEEVMKHVARLWGFDVHLETIGPLGETLGTMECKADRKPRRRR
jgi:stage V sporulation protein R